MPRRKWRLRVEDIIAAAEKIVAYTATSSFEEFCTDSKTIEAVDYNLVVIGEAARHVPSEIEGRYPRVPWKNLRDMRNVVAHEYFGVNLRTLWETTRQDVPGLLPLLRELLEREPPEDDG